jgi:hypothetical protein
MKSEALDLIETYCSKQRIEFVKDLFKYLCGVGFLEVPASTKHHNSMVGGLIEHSINVTKRMILSNEMVDRGRLSNESLVIVGLFHDVHKCVSPDGDPYYVRTGPKKNGGERAVAWQVNPAILWTNHPAESLVTINRFLPLKADERQAIAFHDGLYARENYGLANHEHHLTMYLHHADVWCAFFEEPADSTLNLLRTINLDRNEDGTVKEEM